MESVDFDFLNKVWNTKGKNLKKPEITVAQFRDKKYYVFRDNSYIIFMIPSSCSVTYALPKKYTTVKKTKNGHSYYKINSIENSSVVSCIGTKSEYESLILDNIITNPTC